MHAHPSAASRAALAVRTVAAWGAALLLFFPIAWLFLTAFKTELQAIHVPPLFVFEPTLENFSEVQRRSDYLLYARNSLITSVGSTAPRKCRGPRQALRGSSQTFCGIAGPTIS